MTREKIIEKFEKRFGVTIRDKNNIHYIDESIAEFADEILAELSEVKESVTDEEINREAYNYCASPDGQGGADFDPKAHSYFIDGAKWLRSRLQPAQSSTDEFADKIEKTDYFDKEIPKLTDEQIGRWADYQSLGNNDFIEGCTYGAKAYRDGLIAEWLKQNLPENKK